ACRDTVTVILAERARSILGEPVAVALPICSAQEGRHDLEIPLADPAGFAPEVGEPEVDVQLEELDARRSLRHVVDRTLGIGRNEDPLRTCPCANPREPGGGGRAPAEARLHGLRDRLRGRLLDE